jgi:hypothetical protein
MIVSDVHPTTPLDYTWNFMKMMMKLFPSGGLNPISRDGLE